MASSNKDAGVETRSSLGGYGPPRGTLGPYAGRSETVANVSVLLGNGNGSFQAPRHFASGNYPWAIGVGDFNGDKVPDLAVANDGSASVLLGNGDGTFQAVRYFGAGSSPRSVAMGDFNGDGLQDLAVANGDSNDVSVLINNTPQ